MEIPYAKLFIYLLTFLVYAYSGYGSNLLSNLRDAVLSAESVFGDVLTNVVKVANKFKALNDVFDAAVEENCVFKCPVEGTSPKVNRNHAPSSNGCGTLGFKIDSNFLPIGEMSKCCNEHDICYDTCNSKKEVCDLDFKRCLYHYCDTHKTMIGEKMVKGCKSAAKILYTGTVALGCKAYLDSQETACYCAGGRKKQYKSSKYAGGEEL